MPAFKQIIGAKYRLAKSRWYEDGGIAGFKKYPDRSYFVLGWCGRGLLALYELTNDRKYVKWAEHACDVVLTYLVVWDIDLPAARLRDQGFRLSILKVAAQKGLRVKD